jgi:hypothetical protein
MFALLQRRATIWTVPRQRPVEALDVVHRTARIALRTTPSQRRRCFGLLRSGGDIWACVLELSAIRRRRGAPPLVNYQELCRELSAAGPGTFGELSSVGARSILRRYSDAWMTAAKKRKQGDASARYPRRRRRSCPRGTTRAPSVSTDASKNSDSAGHRSARGASHP